MLFLFVLLHSLGKPIGEQLLHEELTHLAILQIGRHQERVELVEVEEWRKSPRERLLHVFRHVQEQ